MFKRNKIIIFFIIFLLFDSIKAFAEPKMNIERLKNFTVKADISEIEDFKDTIYVYIYDSKNQINVFELNRDNNFISTYEFPVGEAKLFKVMVNSNNEQIDVPYTYEGNLITTEKSEDGSITIKISREFYDEENFLEDKEIKNEVQEENLEKERQVENKNSIEQAKNIKFINLVIDIILIIFFTTILGYLKYREKKQGDGKA